MNDTHGGLAVLQRRSFEQGESLKLFWLDVV